MLYYVEVVKHNSITNVEKTIRLEFHKFEKAMKYYKFWNESMLDNFFVYAEIILCNKEELICSKLLFRRRE